jgi:excisionase family DNA binding protein
MTDAHASQDSPALAPNDEASTDKLAFSLIEVARKTGFSRSSLYEAVADGRLPARKFGRRTAVLKHDLDAFLSSLPRYAS